MTHHRRITEPWPAAFTAPYLARRAAIPLKTVYRLIAAAGLPHRLRGKHRVYLLKHLKDMDPDLWESLALREDTRPPEDEDEEEAA